ncbi:NAD(P)-binding protein [Basidiobolus meristosporus CBS 931.73]|uniref:NAD(P)-binding protein n=1 Tax=Basidiobolus meristosporus CBS 931.73 TaxID=1314790 RepID=A0A1Y1Y4R5_9FUNG|nr:NAD(P)-binding protein [Basidiobolus meristosporus CBS 931.73]|eukprot:ORX93010.1 NAD(P)-binding protein [Basidiobolus meristosporus CBS 931.73]
MKQCAWWKTFVTPSRYSYDRIPDQTGKVAIVTGANSGLGFETTVALAGRGAHVFLACRSKQRALDAIERANKRIREQYPKAPGPKLEFLELDLNDMNKTKKAAQEFLRKGLPLHLLVNNSGIANTPFGLTVDGIESQFGVNHMGHFVFTMELLDRMKESQPSRIVVLSSIVHEATAPGGIDFETLNDESMSTPYSRYCRSKLANLLFAKALARRLQNEKVYVNVLHPGWVATGLDRHVKDSLNSFTSSLLTLLTSMVAMKPKVGALTQLYLATSPEIEVKDIRGRYFIPIANEIQPSAYARDVQLQEELWKFSEKMVKEKVYA